jgi:hypothetical protein
MDIALPLVESAKHAEHLDHFTERQADDVGV